jgi:hypothetical protein
MEKESGPSGLEERHAMGVTLGALRPEPIGFRAKLEGNTTPPTKEEPPECRIPNKDQLFFIPLSTFRIQNSAFGTAIAPKRKSC